MWQQARFVGGFVQREPREGEPATQPTEVAFVYTDDALYVGARLREAAGQVRALVTRRDREESSDQLLISLDTYRDYRTAYTFAVTAAGVRIDYYHRRTSLTRATTATTRCGKPKTQVDSLGWTAEITHPVCATAVQRGRSASVGRKPGAHYTGAKRSVVLAAGGAE